MRLLRRHLCVWHSTKHSVLGAKKDEESSERMLREEEIDSLPRMGPEKHPLNLRRATFNYCFCEGVLLVQDDTDRQGEGDTMQQVPEIVPRKL